MLSRSWWFVRLRCTAREQKEPELVGDACYENKRKQRGQKVCQPPRTTAILMNSFESKYFLLAGQTLCTAKSYVLTDVLAKTVLSDAKCFHCQNKGLSRPGHTISRDGPVKCRSQSPCA